MSGLSHDTLRAVIAELAESTGEPATLYAIAISTHEGGTFSTWRAPFTAVLDEDVLAAGRRALELRYGDRLPEHYALEIHMLEPLARSDDGSAGARQRMIGDCGLVA